MSHIGKSILALLTWTLSRVLMAVLQPPRRSSTTTCATTTGNSCITGWKVTAWWSTPPCAVLLQRAGSGPPSGNTELGFRISPFLVMGLLDGAAVVWLQDWLQPRGGHLLVGVHVPDRWIWFRIDLLPARACWPAWSGSTAAPSRPLISALGAAAWAGDAYRADAGPWARGPTTGVRFRGHRRDAGTRLLPFFGWDRSTSPLTWQSDRGLVIESIMATVFMLRHARAT